MTRRRLLEGLVASLGAPFAAACSSSNTAGASGGADPDAGPNVGPAPDGGGACPDPFAGGELLGTIPFVEDAGPLERLTGAGLGARLFTDLSKLEPDALITPNETYYIRTGYPDQLDPSAPWVVRMGGLVKTPVEVGLDALLSRVAPTPFGPFVMECSGNGSFASFGMLSAARWSGIPMKDVLSFVEPLPSATRVLISGFDQHSQPPGNSIPGASWIFTFDELESAGAFLATEMNGVPLPKDHGAPIRLMVPNWYGCTCIKWVDEIRLVDDDAPATEHMKEFASRTHQKGSPELARDFVPATMDQAAMPVRIERWRVRGELLHRVVGIMWGGYRVTNALTIRLGEQEPFVPVDVCPPQRANQPWTLWTHAWRPRTVGRHVLRLAVADESIPTKRLDRGFYDRAVDIVEI